MLKNVVNSTMTKISSHDAPAMTICGIAFSVPYFFSIRVTILGTTTAGDTASSTYGHNTIPVTSIPMIRGSFSFWQMAPIASPTIKISDNDANINPPFLFLDMSITIFAVRILTVSKTANHTVVILPQTPQSALFYFPPETNLCNRFHRKR